ncbi:Phosphate regulon transcriptional regulatory protein PhoB (SphR) [Minicystis rosea]|nr:Phosphate regulon transcriptional regulatory protein PhoB (SphR) [Minicystis rosea]
MTASVKRVLVVEDDSAIAAGLVRALGREGFEVELSTVAAGAAKRVIGGAFDVVVLDLMLPDESGFAVLAELQHRAEVPVIVLTARTDLADRLRSFTLGAADYVSKPFFADELVARIHARLGGTRLAPRRRVCFGDVALDLDARAATVSGQRIDLTKTELNLLVYLAERPGRAIARGALAEHVLLLQSEADGRTVDAHIARLRKKLGSDGARIVTVWGLGYRFEPEAEP